MLSADDVQELKIPLGLYPSNDEPLDEVSGISGGKHERTPY